jgi:methionyl-tRNA formyltransferase
MKVGFAGTPEFARIALDALLASEHAVALVMTQPDRPKGRGQKLSASPVKLLAGTAHLPLYQPEGLRLSGRFPRDAEHMHQVLKEALLDVLVVAAYGLILPESFLAIPKLGCLNIHASLLPRWRGAAPIQRAIEAGDATTGVTIMQMDAGLDTGPMLTDRAVEIGRMSTAELTPVLAEAGAKALLHVLQQLAHGTVVATPQPALGVTYAAKVAKSEAVLDLSLDAAEIERRVRAFDPAPGVTLMRAVGPLKIWRTSVASGTGLPGTVLDVDSDGIVIACGTGALRLELVQEPGGRRQPAAQFARAAKVKMGELLQ